MEFDNLIDSLERVIKAKNDYDKAIEESHSYFCHREEDALRNARAEFKSDFQAAVIRTLMDVKLDNSERDDTI